MGTMILLYGVAMAVLVGILKFVEYSFLVKDLSVEFYAGTIALLFTSLGIWAGRKLTRTKVIITDPNFALDSQRLERLGISKREYEVLELIAQGLSNQEIAEKLFVSLPTVKTHSSNLFLKLNARRRTEAIKAVASLFYAGGWEVYYNSTDLKETFMPRYTELTIKKMQHAGKSEEEINKKREEMKMFAEWYKNPFIRFGMTLMEIFPVGLVITLISAGILRRKEVLPVEAKKELPSLGLSA